MKVCNSKLSQELDMVKTHSLELIEEVAMTTKKAYKLKEALEGERNHIPEYQEEAIVDCRL